jgi:putative ABC transport system permease protein
MERVFGLPVGGLTVGLVILMATAGALIGVVAIRHRVFFRMGVRNIWRRPARSVLIVVGLMLGTAIICSALITGDSMGRTVRSAVLETLGPTDEHVVLAGSRAHDDIVEGTPGVVAYFDQSAAGAVESALQGSALVDGVAPAVIETLAVQDRTSGQNEPQVTLFGADRAWEATSPMRASDGARVSLDELRANEVYLDDDAADELRARAGDQLVMLAGGRTVSVSVRAIVDVGGVGTAGPAVLMPLGRAQALLGHPGQVSHVLVSNTGGIEDGARLSDQVLSRLEEPLSGLGLEVEPVKQDGLDIADAEGNAFMTLFTTFGSFSMAAGILLIFLVFVMLAAERRGEMGMARAVGTQRGHLVETFVFEGAAYDVAAAAVGAFLGVGLAYLMVTVTAQAFETSAFEISFGVRPRSLLVAYGIGMLLTLGVVTISAWRVSRLNIVSAIRDLPEAKAPERKRRRWAKVGLGLGIGTLMAFGGVSGNQATPFMLGVSIVIASLVPVGAALNINKRVSYTVAGVALVVWWLLPFEVVTALVGDLSMDFSIWVTGGLAIVVGATWALMYNADALLGAGMRVFGRIRSLTPVLKMSMAYPLRSRFRTAVTLAMFTLVVFTLVTGSVIPGSFNAAVDDPETVGGGFDVRAVTATSAAGGDMQAALTKAPGVRAADFDAVASESVVPVELRQEGVVPAGAYEDYLVRGLDDRFLEHTTFSFAAMARGYDTAEQVWHAVARQPGLAVVDSIVAPRRQNWNGGAVLPDFKLQGFFMEDGVFDPVTVSLRDPQTGAVVPLTIIGVLSDATLYQFVGGVSVSQRALAPLGERARPTVHFFSTAVGVDPEQAAADLERAFLASGMEAEAITETLDEVVGGSQTFIRLIQGFMALGLLVGVAALGVISARSVVERRQQLGVLRAIGFQREMVRRTLLLESSFVALTAIVAGTVLGLIMSYNVIADAAQQPSWENLAFTVPWVNLAVIFTAVYLAAMGATFLPAVRASRLYPAEALRYQ